VLNLYRRHRKGCRHRQRNQKKCQCPIWTQGTLHEKWLRKSLDLSNWEAAQKLVRDWESRVGNYQDTTVALACHAFMQDCEARKLSDASLGKYGLLTKELTDKFGKRSVASLLLPEMREYRATWQMAPISARKKLERLRTLFQFCVESGWMRENPARAIKAPLTRPMPTLPFTDREIEKILWATEVYPNKGIYGFESGKRVRAFINLLRYSGLRIRDAATLSRDTLQGNKLLLYTQKTGQPVWLPLPKNIVKELEELNSHGKYFFWSGKGLAKSTVADWQRTLATVFKLAGIEGHAHRFRDTFSVNLLQAGVPLETVSVLLGHASIRVTERHYSPWVKSRQLKLEESIEKAWNLM
jgi:integrase/recombinase XerD